MEASSRPITQLGQVGLELLSTELRETAPQVTHRLCNALLIFNEGKAGIALPQAQNQLQVKAQRHILLRASSRTQQSRDRCMPQELEPKQTWSLQVLALPNQSSRGRQ